MVSSNEETLKAGCFLVDLKTKKIALVYREKQKDFSFPKGHLDEGESIKECALRETAEETKRESEIVEQIEPYVEKYITPRGEKCACYMYVALDKGKSDNSSEDTHKTIWVPFDQVEETLSYPSLKSTWNNIKDKISDLFD